MEPEGEKVRPLNVRERVAIRKLRELATMWPESLWLFSASGGLCVMQTLPDGTKAYDGISVDPEYIICGINGIMNDGGDW